MSFVDEAEQLALQHHHGQKYLDQTYMDGHIYPVVAQAEIIARGCKLSSSEIEVVIAVAFCHDLVEDTKVTLGMIKEISRVPLAVPVAVDVLTKKGCTQSTASYLASIVESSSYAMIVKLADSMVNLRTSLATGSPEKILRYSNNINFLSTALCREIERRRHER